MVGIILISEGNTSKEMLRTVQRALGKKSVVGITALVIRSDLGMRTLKSKVNLLIRKLRADQGVLIMTELFGSTQSNICMDFLLKGEIELLCGYNLPMVLKAATINKSATIAQVARESCLAGKKYIKLFSS